ncbi:MAG: hypothetical protein COA79_11210 [Planctomycetota bacterium]|nr:MAG: hypothetical protein COA79_11210 [Planctomycetota bacterium]
MSETRAIQMDDLAIKVGGMFSLVTLINLRYRDIQNGAKPLVNASLKNIKNVVLKEINEDKISLKTTEEGAYELIYEDDDDFFLED